MAIRATAWNQCPFCECGDRARISVHEGRRLFHCPALWPDLEVISIILLQISLIVTISLVLYLINILFSVHGVAM